MNDLIFAMENLGNQLFDFAESTEGKMAPEDFEVFVYWSDKICAAMHEIRLAQVDHRSNGNGTRKFGGRFAQYVVAKLITTQEAAVAERKIRQTFEGSSVRSTGAFARLTQTMKKISSST